MWYYILNCMSYALLFINNIVAIFRHGPTFFAQLLFLKSHPMLTGITTVMFTLLITFRRHFSLVCYVIIHFAVTLEWFYINIWICFFYYDFGVGISSSNDINHCFNYINKRAKAILYQITRWFNIIWNWRTCWQWHLIFFCIL